MILVNLTPHEIVILASQSPRPVEIARLPPSGRLARVDVTRLFVRRLEGEIEVYKTSYGAVSGLPAPEEGTYFVASLVVAQAAVLEGRADVLSPGELVRGDDGKPVGCLGLTLPEATPSQTPRPLSGGCQTCGSLHFSPHPHI